MAVVAVTVGMADMRMSVIVGMGGGTGSRSWRTIVRVIPVVAIVGMRMHGR